MKLNLKVIYSTAHMKSSVSNDLKNNYSISSNKILSVHYLTVSKLNLIVFPSNYQNY